MTIIRSIISIISFLLLGWLFMISFPEFDLARIKFPAFYKEQILEIEDSNSISELKNIAKSKVYEIQRINALRDGQNETQLYIIFTIFAINILLHLTEKPAKTHNS